MASYRFLTSASSWGAVTINLGGTYYLGKLIGSHNCSGCGDVHLEYSLDCSGYTRLTSAGVSTWQANSFAESVRARCVYYPVPNCGPCYPPPPSLSVYEYLYCNTLTVSFDKTEMLQGSQFTVSGSVKDQYGNSISGQTVTINTYAGGTLYISYSTTTDASGNFSKTISVAEYRQGAYEVRTISDNCTQSTNIIIYRLNNWLSGWSKRKSKAINGSTAGSQNIYQMKLTIHKDSGLDGPNDVFLSGSIKDDFSDLRFTGSDGSTLLSYWIESISGTGTSVATVWIRTEVPASPNTNTIYIYYHNPLASQASSLANTFIQETSFGMFSANWKYSGLISGVVTGWESPLTQFNYDTSAWTTLAVNGMPQTTLTPSRFFFRKEFFLLPGSIQFSGGVDDQDVWTTIKSNGTYTRIGGDENSVICCAHGFTHTFTVPSEGRYIWTGRGSNGTTPYGGIYINAINTGLNNIYERNVLSPEPIFGTSGNEELAITATHMTLSNTNCIGPCSISAGITWQSYGNGDIIFRPAVIIDEGTPDNIIAYATIDITILGNNIGSGLVITPALSIGTHTICPYPN